MANDGSLGVVPTQFQFDLDTQAGVMQLLAAVRASALAPEEKSELRDLVFLYANGGKDQSVRMTIEQKVTAYGIAPIAGTPKRVAVTTNTVGMARPAPSFAVSGSVSPQPAPQPSTVPPQPSPATTQSAVSQPVPVQSPPTPPNQPAAQTAPVKQSSQPQVQSAAAPSEPPVAPTPQPVPTEPAAVQVPVTAAPPAQPPVQQPPVAAQDQNQYLQRIKEIKSLVNEKVGNPVNLVDIDNEVGREYMAALLDAMKKLNSGASVVAAMDRLETSYKAVEQVIKDHASNTVPVASSSQPQPQSQPAQTNPPQSAPVVSSAPPVQEAPTQPAVFPSVPVQTSPTPSAVQTPPVQQTPPAPEPRPTPVVPVDPTPPPAPPVEPAKPDPAPIKRHEQVVIDTSSGVTSSWGSETDTIKNEHDQTTPSGLTEPSKISSVADAKGQAKTPDELPKSSAIETSSKTGDPLFTKEVDDGLQQLLLEWPLFKKSGLFGTGPKGREHPLFKKLASLPIPLVLAGRFEGSTQEIKQSVTDYMNGWRYEQGIMYVQGEAFEHYLRRVIYHILELQKKKAS